jgi:hypothetical protein
MPRWNWVEGVVSRDEDHFGLSYGDDARLIALVGRGHGRGVIVQYLIPTDPKLEGNLEIREAVRREVEFYFSGLNEPDPWAYAIYHCGTAANIYARVHWDYWPKDAGPDRDQEQRTGPGRSNVERHSASAILPAPTRIFYPRALRELWPRPLARRWRESYPDAFDRDDLKLVESQCSKPGMRYYHFAEWFAAVHLSNMNPGVRILVEKYSFKPDSRKFAEFQGIIGQKCAADLCAALMPRQPPDLFVYRSGTSDFRFVEVKGPGDRLNSRATKGHQIIRERFLIPVEYVLVRESSRKV